MNSNAQRNRQVRLAARPSGLPKRSDWSFTEEAVRRTVTNLYASFAVGRA